MVQEIRTGFAHAFASNNIILIKLIRVIRIEIETFLSNPDKFSLVSDEFRII